MFDQLPKKENIKESQDLILQKLIEDSKIKSIIELRFFRHSIKEGNSSKSDEDVEITVEGRRYAKNQSELSTDINQSLAFGSPRKRTQETAMFVMSGQEDEISGNENFDELKNKLNKEIKYGSKIGIDKRLDFKENHNSQYYKEITDNIIKGEYLKYLIEKSDIRAQELGSSSDSTYTGLAQQIALIIKKYVTILPRWTKIVTKNPDKNIKLLERFMGTHQGVGESFLAKIIELYTGDTELRDKFIKSLNNTGFEYVEGFKVYLADAGNQYPEIIIDFKHNNPKDPSKNFEFSHKINYMMIDEVINGEDVSWF
jgi:hypothetical protein